jgi:LmbE family N-acetylglucosaminyl deacetylase
MNILAIGAHLDDIELACGGTLSKAIKNGHKVKMLVMTDSSYTNFDGKVLRTREQALQEGTSAAKVLSVNDLEILDLPIKNIPYNGDTVEKINAVIDDFKPDYIFTHWIHDTHQDHMHTAMATISAARYKTNIFMYEPFPPSGRSYMPFRPQAYFDITETIEDKVKSLREHKSQHDKYGEDWTEAVRGRARARGFESGYKYAEVFEIVRTDFKL